MLITNVVAQIPARWTIAYLLRSSFIRRGTFAQSTSRHLGYPLPFSSKSLEHRSRPTLRIMSGPIAHIGSCLFEGVECGRWASVGGGRDEDLFCEAFSAIFASKVTAQALSIVTRAL